MEGKAQFYQVYSVSRTTGEGRADIFKGVGTGGAGVGGVGATQSMQQL